MKKLLLSLVCLLFFSYGHAANDRAFFWEVASERVTVYLLGSIHFADKSFYPLRRVITDAFSRSENLVVELDITSVDQAEYNELLLQGGINKDGNTLRDVISKETWLQLEERLKLLNVDYDAIKQYRPGVLVMQLTAMQMMQLGFDPQHGIDVHFLREALSRSKNIIELETLDQQMSLFLNAPDGELLLKESLHSLQKSEEMMLAMIDAWKSGDEIRMSELLFEDAVTDYPAFADIYDSLIFERNKQMTIKIKALLQMKPVEKAEYFVVVGAGHLIGQQGIVNALKENGYKVKRL
jgi:uncharacterized protein YbaP (TraB family)